jgi:hypothetical protein
MKTQKSYRHIGPNPNPNNDEPILSPVSDQTIFFVDQTDYFFPLKKKTTIGITNQAGGASKAKQSVRARAHPAQTEEESAPPHHERKQSLSPPAVPKPPQPWPPSSPTTAPTSSRAPPPTPSTPTTTTPTPPPPRGTAVTPPSPTGPSRRTWRRRSPWRATGPRSTTRPGGTRPPPSPPSSSPTAAMEALSCRRPPRCGRRGSCSASGGGEHHFPIR